MSYHEFLESKSKQVLHCGFDANWMPEALYPFQREAVRIATMRGRNAMFQDCGMGKTIQQLTWAENVRAATDMPVLVVAPLAVVSQTSREADHKLNMPITQCRHQDDCTSGINITNYEMLHHFNPHHFGGIVLDESAILKGYSGKFRQFVTEFAQPIPYRLPCTATPAPNDLIELINHSEFLSVLRGKEAIALYFIQDGNTTHKWRLKGHAQKEFWRWVAAWAIALQKPSDIGFSDDGFVLPELTVEQHIVDGHIEGDFLFPVQANTMQERRTARRESVDKRVQMVADIANSTDEPVIVWCDLNLESEALTKAIKGAVQVKGADTPEDKVSRMMGFVDGTHRVIVTKPSIAGHGMNWQHCNTQCFTGLSDSFEQFYQAVRRSWRYGQKRPVTAHIVTAETEGAVVANINRKERQSHEMMRSIVANMKDVWTAKHRRRDYAERVDFEMPSWLKGV
jgi:hypothetical protein